MYEYLTTNLKNNKKKKSSEKKLIIKKNSKKRYKIDVKIQIYFLKLALFNE